MELFLICFYIASFILSLKTARDFYNNGTFGAACVTMLAIGLTILGPVGILIIALKDD